MPAHRRRSVRLRHHDYAGGLYFATVCTHGRQPLFGEVVDGAMVLSALGEIARDEWARTEAVRANVILDAFVVMPDHVHLLFGIVGDNRLGDGRTAHVGRRGVLQYAPTGEARRFKSPSQTVGAIIRGYKGAVTRTINETRKTPGAPVWQRGYHDRVVRTDAEAVAIRRYIEANPAQWAHRATDRRDGHWI